MQARAKTFNEKADLYDKMRPGYPDIIFSKLQKLTRLGKDSKILEVGCGTGQATKDLVQITDNITCVEPGADLFTLAKQNFPDLKFINEEFENFETTEKFDLVIAATAWHWVDPASGYKKAHNILRDDGYLAILRNYHIEPDPSAFLNRAEFIFAPFAHKKIDLASRYQIEETAEALENKYFHIAHQVEYSWKETYTTDEYIALRNTYSPHRAMNPKDRESLEKQLRDFADDEFNGKVTQNYLAVMMIAKKR